MGSNNFVWAICAAVGIGGLFFFMGAPFIAMNDMLGHEMNRNNPGGKKHKAMIMKNDPRTSGGFWGSSSSAGVLAEPPEPSQEQTNPFVK